jgi:tRNA (adenine37-N6)-methyltransferase
MARSLSAATWAMSIAATSFLLSSAVLYWYHKKVVKECETKFRKERQAERTGRIRAEVRLRTAIKESKKADNSMILKCIGTIVSPYTKRMGTPRQGALAPASRAFIQFSIPFEAVEGLEQYSHLWIIFEFHANTDQASSKKTKIRPPRGGGIRVGQLATRSPHRPNALGLSLVKIAGIDAKNKRLHISALDLVNGTPVYDIKPCVPWDIPGHFDGVSLHVPDWVEQDDSLRKVVFTKSSEQDLRNMISENRLGPLYNQNNDGFQGAIETLEQVLAQDPRASNKRGTSTQKGEATYKIIFVGTQVEFRVTEGVVEIMQILPMNFEDSSYVDGIPLTSGK